MDNEVRSALPPMPGCGMPATASFELYRAAYSSLDAVVYVCGDHADPSALRESGLTPFRVSRTPVPGTRCGAGWNYAAMAPLVAPDRPLTASDEPLTAPDAPDVPTLAPGRKRCVRRPQPRRQPSRVSPVADARLTFDPGLMVDEVVIMLAGVDIHVDPSDEDYGRAVEKMADVLYALGVEPDAGWAER